jgi:hypothetical protein
MYRKKGCMHIIKKIITIFRCNSQFYKGLSKVEIHRLEVSKQQQSEILSRVYGGALSKGCHLDVVRGSSTPHDPESDAGGSLTSWQGHPSR